MSELVARPTVLVVDDEALVAQLVEETLEEAGFQVIVALSYAEAVSALETAPAKLAGLVTDVNLGKSTSGWDLARRARELMPAIPVVYVTGDSGHEWPASGVPQSVVITKPFAAAQITVALSGLANQTDIST
jgi:CheY-like chemotaxis protein